MSAQLGILNVGAGDTKLVFDKNNPAESIRAARIVKDMLRRGYALLVEFKTADGRADYRRVHDFDENTCEYIIADFDPVEASNADLSEERNHGEGRTTEANDTPSTGAPEPARKRGGKRAAKIRVAAESASGVAVARSAGG